jgi:Mn-dependent DtxR family transcriptional regulator
MGRKSGYPSNRKALLALIANTGHGRSPSVRWIADELDVGVATAHSYLELLADEGMIEWTPRQHRSIRLTLKGSQALQSLASSPT